MVNEPSPSSGVVVDEPHDDYMAGRFCIQLVFQTDTARTDLFKLGRAIHRFRSWAGQQTGRRTVPPSPSATRSPKPAAFCPPV